MRVIDADDIPCELDDGDLHAEADAEERHFHFPGSANGLDHAFDAAHPEPARYQQAVIPREQFVRAVSAGEQVARDPVQLHTDAARDAAVNEPLLDALVAVHEVRVLADDGDAHRI